MAGLFRRLDEDGELQVVIRADSKTMAGGHSKKPRCYLIVIFLLSLIILALSVTIAVIKVQNKVEPSQADSGNEELVCTSEACHVAAGDIISMMNTSVNPCDDYYAFACGNFIANTFMQPSDVQIDVPLGIAERAKQILYQDVTCSSETCLVASGVITAQMNLTADPCVDFYNYACGSFVEDRFLRPAQTILSQFSDLTDENSKVLYKELTNDKVTIFGDNSSALVKVKNLHKLCMDVTKLQRDGHKPLLKAIEEFGSWAITNDTFDPATWNFTTQLLKLHRHGLAALFSVSVDADEKSSAVNILNLYQHGITLSSEKNYNLTQSVNVDKKQAFVDYGVEVARLLGSNETQARVIMQEIYTLELELAAIYVPSEIIRNPKVSYNKMNITEVKTMFEPHLDILEYLTALTNRSDIGNDNHLVSSTTPYFKNLKTVLDKYLNSDELKRVMNNYLTWYMVHRTIDNLSSDFQFAQLILSRVTDGTNSIDERWKICTDKMASVMGRATGAAFIEGRFDAADKDVVTGIVKSVTDTLVENFPGYEWMDEETVNDAVVKARAIDTRIGYPDYITTAKQVDDYYKNLDISDTLYDSILLYRQWATQVNFAKLDKPADTSEWKMTASEVNAYYHPVYNTVVLPAGILQKPFYDTSLPLAWNFGGMGSVIGHEISHGFDDQGSQYDADGNLANWWTNSSIAGFNKAKQCFIDQYSGYNVAGTPLNGRLNLGENIADNGGLAIAYKAYIQRLEDTKEIPQRLPGLGLDDNQLFFLSFAQIWCSKSTPEYEQTSLNYNPHSPSKFRVQGTYSNSKAFSDAYNCKNGAPYNPPTKCKVW